ncbi:MAG: flagellar motor switch protein FliM [Ferrovum sp.]|jgi:flagellar motor switch protein FliM|nr:flagellar motor switch protein FliM [Ferrovum sp.]NDU90610.1 flagellar motor switch protein FliM [Ferrovum sp.]
MNSDFLSQEEVDSLLRGVTGEEGEESADVKEDAHEGARLYNLGKQERIVRGRMPTMEIINERFTRLFRIELFNLVRRAADVSVGQLRVLKFSEFIRNLQVPANINLVQAKPLRGNALFVFDPDLIFLVVDNLFGGDGRFHTRVEGREFTQTEHRIIQKMLDALFLAYSKSWDGIYPLEFQFVRSEMNPQFANIATPNEVVVATTFEVEFGGGGGGGVHICLPYSMIEPIRELLYSSMQGDHLSLDRRWMQLLSLQVQSAMIELVAELAEARVTVEQLLKLKPGDVIPLVMNELVQGKVDNVPVMECHYGVFNNQYALKVERLLSTSEGINGEGMKR